MDRPSQPTIYCVNFVRYYVREAQTYITASHSEPYFRTYMRPIDFHSEILIPSHRAQSIGNCDSSSTFQVTSAISVTQNIGTFPAGRHASDITANFFSRVRDRFNLMEKQCLESLATR